MATPNIVKPKIQVLAPLKNRSHTIRTAGLRNIKQYYSMVHNEMSHFHDAVYTNTSTDRPGPTALGISSGCNSLLRSEKGPSACFLQLHGTSLHSRSLDTWHQGMGFPR